MGTRWAARTRRLIWAEAQPSPAPPRKRIVRRRLRPCGVPASKPPTRQLRVRRRLQFPFPTPPRRRISVRHWLRSKPLDLAAESFRLYTGTVKIALGQINPTIGDFEGNSAKVIGFAQKAKTQGAGLILFPELSICGYPPRDLVERTSFVVHNREAAEHIAAETHGIAVICGLVTPAQANTGKSVMNSAAVLRDGEIAFVQSKMLLPTYDVFDEMRNFAPAHSQSLLPFCGKQMALTICEDAWNDKHFWDRRLYTFDPVEALVHAGGNFLLNISASPFWMGKRELRREMLATIARTYRLPVAMVNQVGGNDSLIFDGSSFVLNPEGQVVAQGKSFEEDLIYFDSDRLTGEIHPQIE